MNKNDIEKKIDVILTNEQTKTTIKWVPIDESVSQSEELWSNLGLKKSYLTDSNKKFILRSVNLNLLRSLYSKLVKDSEKEIFNDCLNDYNIDSEEYYSLRFIYLLYNLDLSNALNFVVRIEDAGRPKEPLADMLGKLSMHIKHDHFSLNECALEEIVLFLNSIKKIEQERDYVYTKGDGPVISLVEQIEAQVNEIEYNRLSNDLLAGVNFEINQDQEKVIESLEKLEFNDDIIESIKYVERKYLSASSNFDYKGCADSIRSFTSEFIKEVAQKIAKLHDEEKPTKYYHKYLGEKRFFSSTEEVALFQSFRNYISTNSVHRLSSEREVARISKNIAIEFALMISQRLEEYMAKQKLDEGNQIS